VVNPKGVRSTMNTLDDDTAQFTSWLTLGAEDLRALAHAAALEEAGAIAAGRPYEGSGTGATASRTPSARPSEGRLPHEPARRR
jgi:hypothetical protein